MRTKLLPIEEFGGKHEMDIWTAELHREQSLLFTQIERIYHDFDEKIKDIAEQGLDISLQAQFMELYYFVLYQELLVLNRFEEPHNELLQSISESHEKMRKYDDEIKLAKCKLKEVVGDDALVSTSGKLIDMELLFRANGT